MNRYGAIRLENGKYVIIGRNLNFRRTSTFAIRDKLKMLGGIWDDESKRWINIDESSLKEIGASKALRVLVAAHCHMPEAETLAYEDEIMDGKIHVSCTMCDTSFASGMTAKILRIIGEPNA